MARTPREQVGERPREVGTIFVFEADDRATERAAVRADGSDVGRERELDDGRRTRNAERDARAHVRVARGASRRCEHARGRLAEDRENGHGAPSADAP